MGKCPFCGKKLDESDNFCSNCGKSLNLNTSSDCENSISKNKQISQKRSYKKRIFLSLFLFIWITIIFIIISNILHYDLSFYSNFFRNKENKIIESIKRIAYIKIQEQFIKAEMYEEASRMKQKDIDINRINESLFEVSLYLKEKDGSAGKLYYFLQWVLSDTTSKPELIFDAERTKEERFNQKLKNKQN